MCPNGSHAASFWHITCAYQFRLFSRTVSDEPDVPATWQKNERTSGGLHKLEESRATDMRVLDFAIAYDAGMQRKGDPDGRGRVTGASYPDGIIPLAQSCFRGSDSDCFV